jgi:lactoylglutathione lyase
MISESPSLRLGYVILHVPDVSVAVSFYQSAFGIYLRFEHESGEYAEFDTGSTILAFASHSLLRSTGVLASSSDETSVPSGAEIAFVANDVEAAITRALNAGATLAKAVTLMPWGQKLGYVRDVNGFLIELCEPLSSS